jgi:hypothetical protein
MTIMPRLARIVIPDISHYITQRGNNRQDASFANNEIPYLLSSDKYISRQKVLVVRRLRALPVG